MKGRDLYHLNESIKKIVNLGLGENPTLSEIQAKLDEFNVQRQKEVDQRDKPYKEKVGKIFLSNDDYGYTIFKLVNLVKYSEGHLGVGYTYNVHYFVKYQFGSFTRSSGKSTNEEVTFGIDQIQNFVHVDDTFLQEMIDLQTSCFHLENQFIKKVEQYIK